MRIALQFGDLIVFGVSTDTKKRGMRGFGAVVFDGEPSAKAALRTLKAADSADSWTKDVAVVSRNRYGAIHAHTDCAPDEGDVRTVTRAGPPTGAMLSLVYGMGALMGASANPESLASASIAVALIDDTSALLLVADEATLADFVAALAPFGGKIIGRWRA
jgi:hypothetical protein